MASIVSVQLQAWLDPTAKYCYGLSFCGHLRYLWCCTFWLALPRSAISGKRLPLSFLTQQYLESNFGLGQSWWDAGLQCTALVGEAWVLCPCVIGVSVGHSYSVLREGRRERGAQRKEGMDTSRLRPGLSLWKPRRHKSLLTHRMGNLDMVSPGMAALYSDAFCSLLFFSCPLLFFLKFFQCPE